MALTDSLISSWELNEASGNRADSHGSLTLTDNNTVGSGTGKQGNAADFERSASEYLSADSGTLFDFGSGDYTIEAWVNPETVDNATRMTIVAKDNSAGRQFTVELNGQANSTTRGAIRVSLFPNNSAYVAYDTPADVLTAGAWYHVIAKRSGNAFVVKVNNVAQSLSAVGGSASFPQTMQATTTQFRVGARAYSGFEDHFDGLIDMVRVWSRATSDAEDAQLYNAGNGLAYSAFGGGGAVANRRRRMIMAAAA